MNDTLLLGPDPVGHFITASIRSVHRKRMSVKEVRGGQTASFALKKVGKLDSTIVRDFTISIYTSRIVSGEEIADS